MQLLVVRHALAGDKDAWIAEGRDDALRPLTKEGRRRMRHGARGLRALVPEVPLLATSPLLRARETAAILSAAYDGAPTTTETPVLQPTARLPEFLTWAEPHGELPLIAIVGHEPHLSALVSWLMTGRTRPVVRLKKGAACLLDFDEGVASGHGRLQWLLTPGQLRRVES